MFIPWSHHGWELGYDLAMAQDAAGLDFARKICDSQLTLGFQTPGEEVFGPQKHT